MIADLAAKASRCQTEIAELQQDSLALDAELGQNGAKAQLHKLQSEIDSKQASAQSVTTGHPPGGGAA